MLSRMRALVALVPLLVGSVLPAAAADREFRFTILHTNDQHGHLLPFAYSEAGRPGGERPSVGGIARRATLVRQLRAAANNPVLLLDAGDTFTRGPFTTTYQGAPEVAAMNAMGYEVAAIGNNEFKARDGVDAEDAAGSQAALLKVVKTSRFPWVCANLTAADGSRLPEIVPYVVLKRGGVRIGVLGLTAPRSGSYPQTRGWKITDPIACANEWIPKVRADCDILVALTHLGTPLDMALVTGTSGIDLVVGGDSHTFLYKPLVLPDRRGIRVPIVQAGEFGANLGRLDVRFTQTGSNRWRLAAQSGKLLPIGPALKADSAIEKVLAPYVKPMMAVVGRGVPVGRTEAERTAATTRVLVHALKRASGADAAVNPDSGGMFETFRSSTVTRYDVYAAIPFHNVVVVARLSGADLRKLVTQPDAGSVSTVPAADIDDARTYRVAMVDYMASSVYKVDAAKLTPTGVDIRKAVIDYLLAPARATRKITAPGRFPMVTNTPRSISSLPDRVLLDPVSTSVTR